MEITGETVTVVRYGTDRYGDRTELARFELSQCAFAPTDTREASGRSEQVVADATLYVRPQHGIKPSDVVIRADGTQWEVQGATEDWGYPGGGWIPGSVVYLSRVTG
jgi:hypothetical protein